MATITIPDLSLVVLIGPSGAGKSTFAARHFLPTEVLSSDLCRGWVSDDFEDLSATSDAFAVLHFIAARRLARGRLTVVDATNVQPEARKPLVELARAHDVLPVAIVFDLPEQVCLERNRHRPDRNIGAHVVRRHLRDLRRSLKGLRREGFRQVYVLRSVEEVDAVSLERQPLWTDRRSLTGPFDIIGDVHGCFDELVELLTTLGYGVSQESQGISVRPPGGRTAIFLGDLVDRGPRIPDVLRLVMGMVADGTALCLPGNHDVKLLRKLRGRNVQINHGLAESLAQLAEEPPEFVEQVAPFLDGLISHYVLDEGRLVVAHAGMKAAYQGRASRRVREFALYGDTTGETDEFGLPIRQDWAADYRGEAMVVYGHTPVYEPRWHNRTINIDTGCVFGGALSALRYPERELVSVPARRVYSEPIRPLAPPEPETVVPDRPYGDLLDIEDVLGRRVITTRLMRNVTIREENAAAALEVMSRFAIDPRWLIYLPPTMSPSETSARPDLLEHPAEAFDYFSRAGVEQVICQEKHMGSRAVVILCRDPAVARRRFGAVGDRIGICYTRTGRPFFNDETLEGELLSALRAAMEQSGLWEELETDWICLDAELLPWSLKARDLLRRQYAAVGAAGRAGLDAARDALGRTAARGVDVAGLLESVSARAGLIDQFVDAYRRYCWPVESLRDLRLAPFQILATQGRSYLDRDHRWQMETLARLCRANPALLRETDYRVVDLGDDGSRQAAVAWWLELTQQGGEGMVIKPLEAVVTGRRGLLQPALKCRGREYLRIIYGPEYTLPDHLERLRSRGLSRKRSLALREFALGAEALERFVAGEPLYRVHECVFGVLALESESVDPRL